MNNKLSWGRYPHYPQKTTKVFWPAEVKSFLSNNYGPENYTLAFGMGRSYGDSCLAVSNNVMLMTGMSRLLAADWEKGIIYADAGLTLDELLKISMPKGWFLPVTPGTRFVTLGGAVANDVHGKNHHSMGTFGCHVEALHMYRSEDGDVICSPHERADLFSATIGGLGLTGIILGVELKLRPIKSNYIDQCSIKFENLEEFFYLSQLLAHSNEYSVAWIDCMAKNNKIGRGHYLVGNHSKKENFSEIKQKTFKFPLVSNVGLKNAWAIKIFNSLYYNRQFKKEDYKSVDYKSFFYPLDIIHKWNKLYGANGFQQYQCVVPNEQSYEVIRSILREVSEHGTGSFLAVLKQFGTRRSPGFLSFPMPGATLALDFPHDKLRNTKLFQRLDALVHEVGGRLYPAKDAHMSAVHFKKAYPCWEKIESLRDPNLLSHFWRRVVE